MLKNTRNRLGIIGELFSFLWKRKIWWLFPVVVMLLIVGALVILGASGGPLAPFIYTLF